MELLSLVAEKVIEFTLVPIGRQLGYLISYHSNVKKLKDELKELQNARKAVNHRVDAAQTQGEDIEDNVQEWLTRANEITELVDKFCGEESHANTNCSFKSCPNLWLRHQISRKAKKMTLEVAEVKEKGRFDRVSYYKPPELVGVPLPSTSSSTINEEMESRISIMNQVLGALTDPNVYMVGLCGLPGVGKTTLAKQVATKAKEQNLFDKVVWVTVTQNLDLKGIQSQIVDDIGMKLDAESVLARASHLSKRLKKEKNLLVVLDDLWDRLNLNEVGIPFDDNPKKKIPIDNSKKKIPIDNSKKKIPIDNSKKKIPINDENNKNLEWKCKILLTSRNEELLYNQMNCRRNIRVGELSEEEAMKLFKENAELSDDSNHIDLLSMAAEVVKQCGGLPLAIVAVAKAMKNKRKSSEWRYALNQLKRPLRRNMTGIKEVDSSLMFSYDHLDTELQSIFMLSAMLSHDPLIIDLLMYSMGLSLLQGVHSMKDAQDALDVLVSKLKASSLLRNSFSNDRFTMHDAFREFSLSIASKEQHALVVRQEEQYVFPSKTLLEGYTRMCLDIQHSIQLPEELYCPTLEFFLLNCKGFDLRIPTTFFKPMNELKVMGLANVHISSLPSSISLLEKLTTLCLHSCLLEDIEDVGKLKNLTILSLAFSNIKQLPCQLAQLTCLKMLNLDHCSKLEVIPPKLLSNLKELEVLYMENSFNKWEAEGSSNGNVNAGLAELRYLTKLSSLNIHIYDASVLPNDLFFENSLERYKILIGEDWEWSSKYETFKTLKLKLDSSIYLKHGIQKLLESVEDLFLDGINDVLSYLDGGEFPHLKHLWIQNNDQIEYLVSKSTRLVAFSNLESLNLHNLKRLKNLCQGHMMAASFKNLRVIKVRNCDELKIIFSVSTVELFSQLVEIDIDGCNAMNGIVVSTNEYFFHKLHLLRMTDLLALGAFHFEEDATDNESNKNVKSLFNSKVSFPMLETLYLHGINGSITSIWDDPLTLNSFGNLKTLIVTRCGFLVKLVPMNVLISLSNLEELEVTDCELLEMVFDFDDLNSYKETQLSSIVPLKKLKLSSLSKLTHVWSNDSQEIFSFPKLRLVMAFDCEELKSMFPASIARGMLHLEELEITNCGIDVIIAKATFSESGAATFVFPKLKKLLLFELPNLRNLCVDRHNSEWPCLRDLFIYGCDELVIFQKEDSNSSSLGEESPDIKYPLFFHKKGISSLKMLTLDAKQFSAMLWNDQLGFAPTFLNLKKLRVYGCAFFVGIFSEPLRNDCCQFDFILPNLESLDVSDCDNLIRWGPSFISFKNLTDINVERCVRLTSLLTSYTATSLVQLTRLRICCCENIEEIIAKDENDDVEKEIIYFKKLRSLELEGLSRLKSFCSHNYTFMFPSLDEVIIRDCSRMSMFCPRDIHAPLLKGVLKGVEFGEETEEVWESNLNKTIQLLFLQEITYLELYPEMKILWVEKLPHYKPFSKLERLVLDNCDFLCEYVIPAHLVKCLSNLEELEVHNCHSVKAIFDVKVMELDEEARTSLPNIGLRKLKLHHLPNLKCVWTEDYDVINCFQHLQELLVCECESLINIFVESTAKGLTQLEKLEIESCELLEVIVAEDHETSELESPCFVFPQLEHLELRKLPNLKSFYPQTCTFECPQLTYLFVYQCENLKAFDTRITGITILREEDQVETQSPLFLVEKVIPRLEGLTLNQKDATLLRDGQFQAGLFDKVETLCLESFLEKSVTFPYSFLERFPNLEELRVEHSCFEEILPSQSQTASFKKLYVGYLDQLKTIWDDDSELQPIHQDLESLQVECCCSLIKLTPPLASFENLTHLIVSVCHQLIYLVTSSTAKSLVNLIRLEITDCERMEEIVRNESEEDAEATITFKLWGLELTGLTSLKSFCSQNHTLEFPELEGVTITECHQMKMFCPGVVETPELWRVEIDGDISSLKGDLNNTIEFLLLNKDGTNMYKED